MLTALNKAKNELLRPANDDSAKLQKKDYAG